MAPNSEITDDSDLMQALEQATRHLPERHWEGVGREGMLADYLQGLRDQVARPEARLRLAFGVNRGSLEAVTRERCLWHIRRLRGFGGSDMGILYTEYPGRDGGGASPFADIVNAREILRQKLLIALPNPGVEADLLADDEDLHANPTGGHLIRGTMMESVAERVFLASHAELGLERDEKAQVALSSLLAERAGSEWSELELPWLHGMPDGLYRDRMGRRWLVDFKVPASEPQVRALASQVPPYYEGQLLAYRELLTLAGVEPDRIVLAPLSLQRMSAPSVEVPVTERKLEHLRGAGEYYADYLQRLELPSPTKRSKHVRVDTPSARLRKHSRALVAARRAKSFAESQEQVLRQLVVSDLRADHGIDPQALDGTLDLGLLRGAMRSYRSLDNAALRSAAAEAGLDLSDEGLYRHSHTFVLTMPRSRNHPAQETIAEIDELAERAGEDLLSDVAASLDDELEAEANTPAEGLGR